VAAHGGEHFGVVGYRAPPWCRPTEDLNADRERDDACAGDIAVGGR
jgi:hypothetical protein